MKTILIFRFSAMGDVAIAASVMKEVAAKHPDMRFIFATRAIFAPFFNNIPNLTVFSIDFQKKYKGITGIFKLYQHLNKNYKIDAVADLHDVLRSKLLTFFFCLSFKKIKIASIKKGRKEKRVLCHSKTQNKTQLNPTWKRYVDVFQKLGIKTELKPNPIPFNSDKIKKIGVSPFAKHKAKCYPSELMEKVLEVLNQSYQIYLFGGGEKEQKLCEEWQLKYKNVHSLLGKHTLKEELNLISKLDVMLTMDSAGMHLASLCNVPCVSIWGATHAYAGFAGFGQENNPKIQLALPCRPCSVYGNKPCKYKDYRCLYGIKPEDILKYFITAD
jgi:ADP-heptose:LPS heptosyltransferase